MAQGITIRILFRRVRSSWAWHGNVSRTPGPVLGAGSG
jgi:hypothetical protein